MATNRREPLAPTTTQLEQICRRWQQRLGLQDWDIDVEFVRPGEMDGDNHQGEIEWHVQKRTAVMRVMDPVCYPRNRRRDYNVEETIVHELLHLVLVHWPVDRSRDPVMNTLHEQAVEQLTRALVRS
jgi:hypothetical protein